jgi:hypothetical protein
MVLWHLEYFIVDTTAVSPSFNNQKVDDNLFDINIIPTADSSGNDTGSSPECMDEMLVAPDILSADLISDGKTLTSTLWLSSPVTESADFDRVRDAVILSISDALGASTIAEYVNMTIAEYNLTIPGFELLTVETNKTLSGRQAYVMQYQMIQSNNLIHLVESGTLEGDKVYSLHFYVEPYDLPSYVDTILTMIDSFMITPITSEQTAASEDISSTEVTTPMLNSTYSNEKYGVSVKYPDNWQVIKDMDPSDTTAIIVAPGREGSLNYQEYRMTIDVISFYNIGPDYDVVISRDGTSQNWMMELRQLASPSQPGAYKVLERHDNYSGFVEYDNNYVDISVNLSSINYPDKYIIYTAANQIFHVNNGECAISDVTSFLEVPPPNMNFTASPTSLTLRPGEQTDVKIEVTSHSELDAVINLTAESTDRIILQLVPSNITLSPMGSASLTMHVQVPENFPIRPNSNSIHPVKIIAETQYLQDFFLPLTGANLNGSDIVTTKNEDHRLTLTVMPPLSLGAHVQMVVNEWIAPLSGLASFLAGAAAGVSPIIVRYLNKRKRSDTSKSAV